MTTLFSFPSFEKASEKISKSKNWKHGKINFSAFKDGWPDIFIENVWENVHGEKVYYIADIAKPEDFFPNIAAIQALSRYFCDKLEIIIPYFPVGTMERVQKEWEVATAKTLMRILSATPPARSGQTLFHIFDIHDVHERFYGGDGILIRLTTLTELIKERLKGIPNLAIAFPDEWAYKRFKWDFAGYDIIICSKIRDGDRRIIRIQEWDANGKNVVIVDDLIQTWWTLIEAAKAIRTAGAASVSAYASHGVFPEKSHIRLASALDTLYVTDSIPENHARAKEVANMEILEIHSHIAKILWE